MVQQITACNSSIVAKMCISRMPESSTRSISPLLWYTAVNRPGITCLDCKEGKGNDGVADCTEHRPAMEKYQTVRFEG